MLVETLGPPEATAGSVMLAVAPLLVGMQMLMYALMLDIQESPDQPMTIDYRRVAEASAAATVEALDHRGEVVAIAPRPEGALASAGPHTDLLPRDEQHKSSR